jgi:hypothetical protein
MNRIPRRLLAALLTAVLASSYAPAQQTSVPRVTLTPSLGGGFSAPGFVPGSLSGPAALSLAPMLSLTPALQVMSAPAVVVNQAAIVTAVPVALSAVLGASPISSPKAFQPAASVAPALQALDLSAPSRRDRRDDRSGGKIFDGSRERSGSVPVAAPSRSAGPKGFIKNADGVWVGGRVAEQALWINKMHAELSRTLELDDVMDVMDDAYDEARVKLASVEAAASARALAESSVHLEGTRNWIDAILSDEGGNEIAVHTHRVYFHPAPGNPASEISEGIRRASKYLDKAKEDFAKGGLAEQSLGKKFKSVELSFDVRGYQEIEDALRAKEAEFRAAYGDRYHFTYVNTPKLASAPLRAEYNRLVEKYQDQPDGLMGILDGVTYSREVGVGHELNSHKKRISMGLKVTQAGKDFFGKKVLPDGSVIHEYKTEFDAVTEPVADANKPAKDRDVVLWEDKSARVWMPLDKVMEDTFIYKLRIYRENRAIIEESLGGAPLKVAFSVDVGGTNRRAAKMGILVWQDPRQQELMEYLKSAGPALSKEYGFPVSFYFVNSHPGEDPDLFDKTPMDEAQFKAMQQGGGKQNGRKHGRSR